MEAVPTSICRACRLRLLKPSSSRSFSTTSTRLYIPPESPAFIDIPQPHQQVIDPRPRAKGVLPVPRELFPSRRPDKPGPQYLANVTPDPLPENTPHLDHLSDVGRYRLRMAALRKSHLREGLTKLHARKVYMDGQVAARSEAKNRERARLLAQPEREDTRLTNVSVPTAMRPQKPHALSTEEELAVYRARKARHDARETEKHEDRLGKLHTLYMNARTFITDKTQLAAEIDKVFKTNASIWRTGAPDTVADMIKRGRDRGGRLLATDANELAARDQDRMKKIAEKLSGGKI